MNANALIRRTLPAALGLLGIAATSSAQTLTHTLPGSASNDRFGAAVAGGKDVTGDGLPDLVVGAPQDLNIFFPGTGYVRLISGATGLPVATYQGANVFDSFGHAVDLLGDVSAPLDNRSEILVGAPDASPVLSQQGMVRVLSGANGAVLYQINGDFDGDRLGHSVAAIGDVNNDGIPDFVAGAPFYSQIISNGGLARVYSGADGSPLLTFTGTTNNARFGWSVAGGDVNGDGRADIVVGSLFAGVRVYSGNGGGLLHTFTAGTSDVYGRKVAVVTDLNGDGLRDIVIGATQDDLFSPGAGYVQARSGMSGALLWTSSGLAVGNRYGLSISSAGLWNNDAIGDVIVGAVPQTNNDLGYVRILNGATGATLFTIDSPDLSNGFANSVAGLGDWDGDSRSDVAVGVTLAQPNGVGSGEVRVYESPIQGCGQVTSYCAQATNNSTGQKATLSTSGSTSVAANNFVLVCVQMPTQQGALAFYGANQAAVPFQDGFRCVANPIYRLTPPSNTGLAGLVQIPVNLNNPPLPQAQITAGSTWNFQIWYRDPAAANTGSNTSTAVQVSFCP